MRKITLSEFFRLSLIATICITLIIIIIGFGNLNRQIGLQFKKESDDRAQLVVKLITNALLLSDYQEVQSTAQNLISHHQVSAVRVTNKYGEDIVNLRSDHHSKRVYTTELPLISDRNEKNIGYLDIEQSYEFLDNIVLVRLGIIIISLIALGAGLLVTYIWAHKKVSAFFTSITKQLERLIRLDATPSQGEWFFKDLTTISHKFNELCRDVVTMRKTESSQAKLVALAEVASQVAHDIRSPVAAIRTVVRTVEGISNQDKLILQNAADRINQIAGEMLDQRRQKNQSIKPCELQEVSLFSVLTEMVEEKRFELAECKDTSISLSVLCDNPLIYFCHAEPNQLKRVFSNIINNGFESMQFKGALNIELKTRDNFAVISVIDQGHGIPAYILPNLTQRDKTYGKSQGTGLGLATAKKVVEEIGGTLTIKSKIRVGTEVELQIPLCEMPIWALGELTISNGIEIILLDDDPLIHDTWRKKLDSSVVRGKYSLISLYSEIDYQNWKKTAQPNGNRLYIIDYEIHPRNIVTGLDIISDLKHEPQKMLVTGHHLSEKLIEACEDYDVKIIPKTNLPFLLINLPNICPQNSSEATISC